MNIGYAFGNGAQFGGLVGITLAAAGLIFDIPSLTFGMSGVAFPLVLFMGTIAGAGVFGTLYAAGHILTHLIPGARTVMGEPKEPGKKPHYSFAAEIGRNKSVADELHLDLITDSHAGYEFDVRTVRSDHVDRLKAERAGAALTSKSK